MTTTQRRTALQLLGTLVTAGAAQLASQADSEEIPKTLLPDGARSLRELTTRLALAPRRRDFKTVPMILTAPAQWDSAALSEVLAYKGAFKQVWDNTEITGPWLNVMRNSINTQVWSFRHPDFLVVSATHGSAQLALYDQQMWDKYDLAKLANGALARNTLIVDQSAAGADASDFENPTGVFSPQNNSIPALQRRGCIFMACHNAIWEHATKLHTSATNPDSLAVDGLAAELTNHLIAGAILIPGAAATLPELQRAGFFYAR